MGFFSRVEGIEAAQAAELLRTRAAVALDVREPSEWKAGRIRGALHIPMRELAARQRELPKGKKIVVVCRTGSRSGTVTKALRAAGHDVENLDGGLVSWARAGLPLHPPGGRVI
ncbi:MAG TPA: rhodanese-like domain-containing protein [Gaiellaceae bacterium]|jgi:rhodanese-related sulfurtransferase